MRKNIFSILMFICIQWTLSIAQMEIEWVTPLEVENLQTDKKKEFKGEATRTWDLIHTKLELLPDFKSKKMFGKSLLTLRPYQQPKSLLTLDAKGLQINELLLIEHNDSTKLHYEYDGLKLKIQLNKEYRETDEVVLYINYISSPYELEENNLLPSSGKGLHFIDVEDKNPKKEMQLWIQGESESASCWMPTIDAPNERFSQEIAITVPVTMKTISNGILDSTIIGSNGNRTDYWRQDQEHAAYLTTIVVGDFEVTKDNWKSLELEYYTLPEYHKWSKAVFGQTPNMMSFFSDKFGVDFPWSKYAQIVVTDFDWGAMENTTAAIFNDELFADNIDLLDQSFEDIIAHELAHQWFGNYVTCESWAHLALNESFATYGEYLWREHAHGSKEADRLLSEQMELYFNETVYKMEPIVNFHYDDQEELFDSHRYEKGSCVLHMLRGHLGDELFFKSLQHYLQNNKFSAAEIHDFRKSCEYISGEDLTWFFDQWFMKEGHPVLEITTSYKKEVVSIEIDQLQKELFILPISVDFYFKNGAIEREEIIIDARNNYFEFKTLEKPNLVNIDADKILLGIKMENKSIEEYEFQFSNAPLYKDKIEVLDHLKNNQGDNKIVRKIFTQALTYEFWAVREFALNEINTNVYNDRDLLLDIIRKIAINDSSIEVRTTALAQLAYSEYDGLLDICDRIWHQDSSRMLRSLSLDIINKYNHNKALKLAESTPYNRNSNLLSTLARVYSVESNSKYLSFYKDALWGIQNIYARRISKPMTNYLLHVDEATFEEGVFFLVDLINYEESIDVIMAAENVLLDLSNLLPKDQKNKIKQVKDALKSI